MRPLHLLPVMLILLSAGRMWAQEPARTYISHHVEGNILEIKVSDGTYRLMPYTPNIMECSFIPEGDAYDPVSHAVLLEPAVTGAQLLDLGSTMTWTMTGITARIRKSPFCITYLFKDELLSEKRGYVKSDSTRQLEFSLDKKEALYGGGARVLGMNRRGNLLRLYNRAHYGYETHSELMNYTMPLVLSSKRYLIHFDNAPIGYLDLDSQGNNTLRYETISGRMTYQVVAGDSWADIMDQYTLLTGRQPLPPRWALGNFSSRFGYHSEKEVRKTVDLFLRDSIPLDAVVIDIYWFGADIKGHMGNLEFLRDSFPTPDKMMADFRDKGVKTILVTEPFILTTSKRWDEAVEKGILAVDSSGKPYTYDFYFGHTGIIDIYKPEARTWFWNIYKGLAERGVAGCWGDLGEPEVHPSGVIHAAGTADEVHNIYGHDWAGLIYNGYSKDFPDQRPFILMRAGYSGSQRYGMIPWSGDVMRSWGGLKPQTEIALQMGMQGLGYMHSDLGGFAEGTVFDPELYTRWLQYGVFQPIFRPHAQEHIPAEPVYHDSLTQARAKKAVELRYALIPYIYNLAFENSTTGMPLMRPLLFEEPNNKKAWGMAGDYLWGGSFLVSPVTDPKAKRQKVYFPEGSTWYDFYTDAPYLGGKRHTVTLSPDRIPVFVRGGSFIPMVEPVQTTDLYSTRELTLHFYHDPDVEKSEYALYNDDGQTPQAFEKGMYEFIHMKSIHSGGKLELSMESKPGARSEGADRKITLVIHNLGIEPASVFLDGNAAAYAWEPAAGLLKMKLDLERNSSRMVTVNAAGE